MKIPTFESHENTNDYDCLCLYPAVCISDVRKKAGICGKSIKYVTSLPFSCSASVKGEPRWLRAEELKFEAKSTSFVEIPIEQPNEAHSLQLHIVYIFGLVKIKKEGKKAGKRKEIFAHFVFFQVRLESTAHG